MTPDSHALRKAKVYEAALTLTAQGISPAAMTIQQLADAAGIGKGTVYEYFSSKEEILQGVARYCFAQENERIAARFDRCRTLVDLENELVDYLQEVAAQRMSTYRLLASSFGQQAALPECTNACRSQLTALTDALVARLQAAGGDRPRLDDGRLPHLDLLHRDRRVDCPVLQRRQRHLPARPAAEFAGGIA